MEGMEKGRSQAISPILGEFTDKVLEKEYIIQETSGIMRYLRNAVLIFGVLYFLFIIPDAFALKNSYTFKAVLANRCLFLLLIIVLFIKISRIKDYTVVNYWITGYEILASIFFLHTFLIYDSPSLIIQSLGIIVIILVFSVIPNKTVFTLAASMFLFIGFYTIVILRMNLANAHEFSASIVYTALVIVLSSASCYRNNYLKRIQFLNNKILLKVSTTDSLTGIYNRVKFDEELKKEISRAKRYNTPLSIIMFDIDDFKKINDKYGHLVGDKILVKTTDRVKRIIRDTDILARWGGEEFMLILSNTEYKDAQAMAYRLKEVVSNFMYENDIKVTCSIGVTSFLKEDNEYTFVHRVDKLQYAAKNMGKNQVVGGNSLYSEENGAFET